MDTQVIVNSKHLNGVVTSVLHENSSGSTSSRSSTSSSNSNKRPSTLPLIPVKPSGSTTEDPRKSELNPLKNQKLSIVSSTTSDSDKQLLKGSDSTSGISQIIKRKNSLCKQQSLDQFNEVFSSTSDLSRLKDPNQRIKTPGDVPPSVRRTRGKASNVTRFSLYDDRMMSFDNQWSSVPDDIDITVETVTNKTVLQPPEVELLKCNSNSVSSF